MRLGFPLRVYGDSLPSYGGRSLGPESEGGPQHLSIGLAYLHDVIRYLQANDIHMYRMHTRLLPMMSGLEASPLLEQIVWGPARDAWPSGAHSRRAPVVSS